MSLEIRELSKRFGNVVALDNIITHFKKGQITTLLGPSGCGKTTCLRCIAGLEIPDAGEILIDGEPATSIKNRIFLSPEKRGIGMVFQSYAIWPHMTVFDNVAYPLKVRKFNKNKISEKVKESLELVNLEGLEKRYATQLSGGQQQRVALARSLVYNPKILLLDEPLSNLDAKLREYTRVELRELQRRVGITAVYVTHDQAEAMAIADRVIIMNEGKIMQDGVPIEIYKRPNSRFVAGFIGKTNFIMGTVENVEGDLGQIRCTPEITINLPISYVRDRKDLLISIRPEDLKILSKRPVGCNVWEGKVIYAMYMGSYIDYRIKVGELELHSQGDTYIIFEEGEHVYVYVDPERCSIIS